MVRTTSLGPKLYSFARACLQVLGFFFAIAIAIAGCGRLGYQEINLSPSGPSGSLTPTSVSSASSPLLSALNVSGGSLVPSFSPSIFSYSVDVPHATTTVSFTTFSADVASSISVNGIPAVAGVPSEPVALAVGSNPIALVIRRSDSTSQTYWVDVRRADSVQPLLSSLALSAGSLSPVFDPATTTYSASVGFSTASLSITPTSGNVTDTMTINGTPATAGAPFSVPLPNLSPGTHTIPVVVTDMLGNTNTYTLTVTRDTIAALAYTYLKASNTKTNQYAGEDVAIDGDTLAVGARLESSNATGINGNEADTSATDAGAVYVFHRTSGVWAQQAYIKASNTNANDWFGYHLALSGDTLVVAAPKEDSNATGINGNEADNSAADSGAVYVYTRSGTTWSQQAYLKGSNTGAGDQFGSSVAVSGDTVVVGAVYEDSNAKGINGNDADNSAADAGAAYVFTRSGSTWTQQAYIKASNTDPNDQFGVSVSIDGDTLVVSAQQEDSSALGVNGDQTDNSGGGAGAAYVFTRSLSSWSQQAYVKASNASTGDGFGYRVAINGDTLAVSTTAEASNATGINGDQFNNTQLLAGAVYVYTRASGTWSQQAYIKASNALGGRCFGMSLALFGDTLAVGAPYEGSAATGINGSELDAGNFSGAVYLFTRLGSTWSQGAYIKASNTNAWDHFGMGLDFDGESLVIGAPRESSNATGINGNQADNSASLAGAVYVIK